MNWLFGWLFKRDRCDYCQGRNGDSAIWFYTGESRWCVECAFKKLGEQHKGKR